MRYADVSEGDRTVRLYFLENAAQEARKHVYTTDEALLNKMEIRPYENVLNNAFATSGSLRSVITSGLSRTVGSCLAIS